MSVNKHVLCLCIQSRIAVSCTFVQCALCIKVHDAAMYDWRQKC